MNDRDRLWGTLLSSLLALSSACGDDSSSGGSGMGSESASSSDTGSDSQGEGAGMEQGGDGDGDGSSNSNSGDGDGASGDGDGASGDGDGDGDSGDGASGDGDGDGDACEDFEGQIAPVPPSVMFLLDRSGSMNQIGFDLNDPNKSRWNALYESVEQVVGDGADASIAFGAKTFSTWNYGECGVSDTADVPIAIDNAQAILDGIPGPLDFIIGGTPTNLAIEKTLAVMQAHDADGGSKIVFLLTDGGIGCAVDSQQALADAVADLSGGVANDEITTYVIGIAPSNSNTVTTQLHQMAIAGGAPKPGPEAFYRADDAQQLSDALAAVVADSYSESCVMDLEVPPQFPDFTKIVIGNTQYSLVGDCDNEDGFIYNDMAYTQVRVCGAACEALQLEQSAIVQYFCTPV